MALIAANLKFVDNSLPENVRESWLAGESACPTEAQALAQQRGTDAFVCQPGDLGDFFTASYARGSDRSRAQGVPREGGVA